ncbi:hypothetical protein EW146_g9290 [Bondarzewia mesenterica]|uniref:Uncharacterized protein n=1 Tax=Bondarzewia mesenterica TaxID=1095465 RepID=A0A4S4L7R8_9AGAM|nr:hypothetical protein EW146_g9290 [Bondarzewia mesenterica]
MTYFAKVQGHRPTSVYEAAAIRSSQQSALSERSAFRDVVHHLGNHDERDSRARVPACTLLDMLPDKEVRRRDKNSEAVGDIVREGPDVEISLTEKDREIWPLIWHYLFLFSCSDQTLS